MNSINRLCLFADETDDQIFSYQMTFKNRNELGITEVPPADCVVTDIPTEELAVDRKPPALVNTVTGL